MADFIAHHKNVSMKELEDRFKVSMNTIRADVKHLVKSGMVEKVYGGARYTANLLVPEFTIRATENLTVKEDIAERAASMVNDGDVIYIDFGTTVMAIPDYLQDKKDITIVTPNQYVIQKCIPYQNINLIVLPGRFNKVLYATCSENTVADIRNYTFHKVFMACAGVSPDGKMTVTSYQQREIKKAAMQQSHEHFLLAESQKFMESAMLFYAQIEDFDMVFTDKALSGEVESLLKSRSISISKGE